MRSLLKRRFIRDVAFGGSSQAADALLAMVAGVLVARLLGPSARGTLSVLVALGSTGVLLGSLGVHYSGVYFQGRFGSERDLVVSNNLLFAVGGALATGVLLASAGLIFRSALLNRIDVHLFFIYVLAVPFAYFNQFGRSVLFGAGHVRTFYLPNLFEGVALLAGTGAAIELLGNHLAPLVVLRTLIEVCIAGFLVLRIRKVVPFQFTPSLSMLRRQLAYGVRNYASTLLWAILLQSDVVLCNHFLGTARTGVYAVAVSLGLPMTMLAGTVGQLIFQRVSSEDSRPTRIANTNQALRLLLPIATVAILAGGTLAQWFIPLVYGSHFLAAVPALVLLLPGFLAYSLEIVMMNFLGGEGSPPIIVWAPFVGAFANLMANLVIIPSWGIDGASATSSVCYILVLVLVLRYYKRSTGSSLREIFGIRLRDAAILFGRRAHPAASPPTPARRTT